jgi:hypothetical protein
MNMTRKTAVSLFVGLAAVVAIGLNANGKSLLAPTAELPPVDCNINAAFFSCFAPQWGYPAEGLFIWDAH